MVTRRSIIALSPGFDVLSFQLTSWFLASLKARIPDSTPSETKIYIRLFLYDKVIGGIPSDTLSAMLIRQIQSVSARISMEVFFADAPLDQKSLLQAEDEAFNPDTDIPQKEEFRSLNFEGFVQWYGYKQARAPGETGFSKNGLSCVIGNITRHNIETLQDQSGIDFEIGHWFASKIDEKTTRIHGPFASEDLAMEFGKSKCRVVRFAKADFSKS